MADNFYSALGLSIADNDGSDYSKAASSSLEAAIKGQQFAYSSAVDASNSFSKLLGEPSKIDKNGNKIEATGWLGVAKQVAEQKGLENQEYQEQQEVQKMDNKIIDIQNELNKKIQEQNNKEIQLTTGLPDSATLDKNYNIVLDSKLTNAGLKGITAQEITAMYEHPNLIPIKALTNNIDADSIRKFLQENTDMIGLYSGLKTSQAQRANNELSPEAIQNIAKNTYGTNPFEGLTTKQIEEIYMSGQQTRLGKKQDETLEEFINRRKNAQFKEAAVGTELLKSLGLLNNKTPSSENNRKRSKISNENVITNPSVTLEEVKKQIEKDLPKLEQFVKDNNTVLESNEQYGFGKNSFVDKNGKSTEAYRRLQSVVTDNLEEAQRKRPELVEDARNIEGLDLISTFASSIVPVGAGARGGLNGVKSIKAIKSGVDAKGVASALSDDLKVLASRKGQYIKDFGKIKGTWQYVLDNAKIRGALLKEGTVGQTAIQGVSNITQHTNEVKSAMNDIISNLPAEYKTKLAAALGVSTLALGAYYSNKIFGDELTAYDIKVMEDAVRESGGDESYIKQSTLDAIGQGIGQTLGLSTGVSNDYAAGFFREANDIILGRMNNADYDEDMFWATQNYDSLKRALKNNSRSIQGDRLNYYSKLIEYGEARQQAVFLEEAKQKELAMKNPNSPEYAYNDSQAAKARALANSATLINTPDKKEQARLDADAVNKTNRKEWETISSVNGTLGIDSTTKLTENGKTMIRLLQGGKNKYTVNNNTILDLSPNDKDSNKINITSQSEIPLMMIFSNLVDLNPKSVEAINKVLNNKDFQKDFNDYVNRVQTNKGSRAEREIQFTKLFKRYFVSNLEDEGITLKSKGNDRYASKPFDDEKEIQAIISRNFDLDTMVKDFAEASNLSTREIKMLLDKHNIRTEKRMKDKIPYTKKKEKE